MKKDFFSFLGVLSIGVGIILVMFIKPIVIGFINDWFSIEYILFFLGIYFFFKSFTIQEPTSWTCLKCQTELVRSQIKVTTYS